MTNLIALKESIKTEAFGLGFNHLGVAPAESVPEYHAYLKWLGNDFQAGMAYLDRPDARAKRENPQRVLEGCQRVIVLAMPYRPPERPAGAVHPGQGRISAYARTPDYHTVILDRLARLENFIRDSVTEDIKLKSYVDTGPILERAFASLAGIGIAGKNTCLLIQGTGSYFFLAEILTDLPLPIDKPCTRDLCGSCQRCLEACPTQCLLPGRALDANRCLSYLTIENRGAIPDELKPDLNGWVFGCDICQMVCPHNAWIPDQPMALGEPLLPEFMDLEPILTLSPEEFNQAYAATPLSRTRREGLIRNAALILGQQKKASALPALKTALERETGPGVQDACQWAIRRITEGQSGVQNGATP